MTKKHTKAALPHSDFVIPSTVDIRHSSFSELACRTKEGVIALRLNPPPSLGRGLTRNFLKHLCVRRKFFDEHEQTLDCFFRFMTSQAAANQINFF